MKNKIIKSIALSFFAFFAVSCSSPAPKPSRPSYTAPRVVFKPLVTIRNNSSRSVTLGLRGPETRFVSIPARSSRSINLRSGTYKWAATAARTTVNSGYKYFGTNRKYTWNFSIN